MSSTNILKILLLVFIAFALGEIVFTISRYGLPKIDLFKQKPGSCKILEEKYCKSGELISHDINKTTYTFIGFKFPQGERIPVYAAVDGRLLISKESSKEFKGTSAAVKAVTGEVYDLKGNIDTSRFGNVVDLSVKAGDVIGYVQSTNDKNLGSYDAVYTISKAGTAGPESQINKLREMFKK